MDAPPEEIVCPPVRLRRWVPEDLPALAEASAASWEELRPWMPWAQERATEESSLPWLTSTQDQWRSGEAFQYAVVERDAVVGSCGLMRRIGAGGLEIGYWVRTSAAGHGLGTAAAATLTWAGLRLPTVDHLEIHCDAANVRSAAIPARLGYRLVETRAKEPVTPGESEQEQVWRLTEQEWPTGAAAVRWRAGRREPSPGDASS